MKRKKRENISPVTLIAIITPVALVLFMFGTLNFITMANERSAALQLKLNNWIASSTLALTQAEVRLTAVDASLAQSVAVIEENLSLTKEESAAVAAALEATLSAEQQKVAQLLEETEKIGGTVGTLEKLSQTDSELLQKYSKVFFLNEHYVPKDLSEIKNQYLYSEKETQYFHSGAISYLTAMIDNALAANEVLYVKSAYRSFNEQDTIKDSYSVVYGQDTANTFSADQGYSEHQLGTTIDLITTGLGGQVDGFGDTAPYQWLLLNAHKYGFTLSYPENNSYYIFEPWHWRFVGVELATKLYNEGKHFYDLEQREIDEFLVKLFD